MAQLKYWDGAAWVGLLSGPAANGFRQAAYSAKLDATITVSATAYGTHYDPNVGFYCGADGGATILFYGQVGLNTGSDLIITYQVLRASDSAVLIAPADANCLYVAQQPTPASGTPQGPGFVSGVMLATGLPAGILLTAQIHYRVSASSASILRRRIVVVPNMLTVP